MKKITTLALIFQLLFLSFQLKAQLPAVVKDWARHVGNLDSTFKTPVLADDDSEFTYVATFTVNSITGADILIAKYNNNGGTEIWKKVWTGSGNGRDQASAITQDSMYIYVCGITFTSTANNFDYVTIKLNKSDGGILWSSTYNGSASNYDGATALAVDHNGVYVTGISNDTLTSLNYRTIKYNLTTGAELWTRAYDYAGLMDIPFNIALNNDTMAVVGASQRTLTDWDYASITYKTNGSAGDTIRSTGTAAGFDRAQAVKCDKVGNIFITGTVSQTTTGFDIKTIKINSNGSIAWQHTYNSGSDDQGNDLIVDSSGNVYVCGTIDTVNTDHTYVVIKYNSIGTQLWNKQLSFSDKENFAKKMCFDSFGNIVVTGKCQTESHGYDFFTIAIDSSGNEQWRDNFDGNSHGDDGGEDITSDAYGNIYVTGTAHIDGDLKTITIKYRSDYYTSPAQVDTPSVANYFYTNSGQIADTAGTSISNDDLQYYTIHHYPQLYFQEGKMNMIFSHIDNDTATTDTLQRVDVSFENSDNPTKAYPINEMSEGGYYNYFLAHCPDGITDVHGIEKLLYADVYPDIDAIYSSNNAGLKLYFVCKKGSDPFGKNYAEGNIGLTFEGQDTLEIENNWGLKVTTAIGSYVFEKPRVYQLEDDGTVISLPWDLSWTIPHEGHAKFSGWGSYDENKTLVIEIGEPAFQISNSSIANLEWSTYFGGSDFDFISGQVVDEDGNLYLCGITRSSNFPFSHGLFPFKGDNDAIISRYDLVGNTTTHSNLRWSTYYGGTSYDEANDIDIKNATQELYIVGRTMSDPFPLVADNINSHPFNQGDIDNVPSTSTTAGAHDDGFIIRMNTGGNNRFWASYIGGAVGDLARGVAINKNTNDVYVIGETSSDGINPSFPGIAFPLTVSSNSDSYNQNVYAGSGDAFIIKFDEYNELKWSSLFGGNGYDQFNDIKIQEDNIIDIVGYTTSDNPILRGSPCLANNNIEYPICDHDVLTTSDYCNSSYGGFEDGIIVSFNSSDQLIWSTYFGGSDWDNIYGLDINPGSSVFSLTGATSSTDFPTYPLTSTSSSDYLQLSNGGGFDAFLATFDNFSRIWSTYIGGSGDDFGEDLCYDANSKLYVSGQTSSGVSQNICNLPTVLGSFPICSGPGYFNQTSIPALTGLVNTNSFLFSLNDDRSLNWSTYIGGSEVSHAYGIVAFSSINSEKIYLISNEVTSSGAITNFPIVPFLDSDYRGPINPSGNANDCIISRFDISVQTAVSNVTLDSEILVYPNPIHDKLIVESKFLLQNDNREQFYLNIFDFLGRVIYSKQIINRTNEIKEEIDFENFSNGIYFLTLSLNNKMITKKIIKQ